MSQPFNFNTPINQNTTLVARYRCGSAPYAGKWFRVTTTDGKQYVPTTIEEAEYAARIGFAQTSSTKVPLTNVGTGQVEDVSTTSYYRLEFGGGWREWGADKVYGFFHIDANSYGQIGVNLRFLSGYPEGLSIPNENQSIFAIPNSLSNDYRITVFSALNIDVTGFKFNQNMFERIGRATAVGNALVPSIFLAFPSNYYYSGSYSGVGVFGDVEPLFDISDSTASEYTKKIFLSNYVNNPLNYTKGFGFTGQYANSWLSAIPTIVNRRKTYLG